MRCLCSSRLLPGQAVVRGVFLSAVVLSLSACAQSQSYPQSNAGIQSSHQRVAAAVPPRIVQDDDRLPGQHPPRGHGAPQVDDPSEPFSPNYGPGPEPSNGPDQNKPNWQPVSVRRAMIDPRQVEAIIAQAVTAHELRTQ